MTHFDIEAKYQRYVIDDPYSVSDFNSYADLDGDSLLTMEDEKTLIRRELLNNRQHWMRADRITSDGSLNEHAVVIDGFRQMTDGSFYICLKWGGSSMHNSDPDNPDDPPWFQLESDIGNLDEKNRDFITIQAKEYSP